MCDIPRARKCLYWSRETREEMWTCPLTLLTGEFFSGRTLLVSLEIGIQNILHFYWDQIYEILSFLSLLEYKRGKTPVFSVFSVFFNRNLVKPGRWTAGKRHVRYAHLQESFSKMEILGAWSGGSLIIWGAFDPKPFPISSTGLIKHLRKLLSPPTIRALRFEIKQ